LNKIKQTARGRTAEVDVVVMELDFVSVLFLFPRNKVNEIIALVK
jgi:hypothetical protein